MGFRVWVFGLVYDFGVLGPVGMGFIWTSQHTAHGPSGQLGNRWQLPGVPLKITCRVDC